MKGGRQGLTRYRIVLLCLVILTLFSGPRASGKRNVEQGSLFREAESSFRKGDELRRTNVKDARIYFLRALVYFEAVRDRGGVKSGRLLFNIANCYFRLGNPGMADLNYRRAERLRPGDPRIQENLALTRIICNGNSGPPARISGSSPAAAWYHENGPMVRIWLFPAAFTLFWGCFGLYLAAGKKRGLNFLASLGFTVAICGCLLSIDLMRSYREPGGVVVNRTVARQGNSTAFDAAPPGELAPGTEFELVGRKDGWFLIRTAGGKRGWVPGESAELIDQ